MKERKSGWDYSSAGMRKVMGPIPKAASSKNESEKHYVKEKYGFTS